MPSFASIAYYYHIRILMQQTKAYGTVVIHFVDYIGWQGKKKKKNAVTISFSFEICHTGAWRITPLSRSIIKEQLIDDWRRGVKLLTINGSAVERIREREREKTSSLVSPSQKTSPVVFIYVTIHHFTLTVWWKKEQRLHTWVLAVLLTAESVLTRGMVCMVLDLHCQNWKNMTVISFSEI